MVQRKVTSLGYVLFTLLTVTGTVRCLPPKIKIGAIFDESQKGSGSEMAFRYAVLRINQDPTLLPNTTLVYDIQYATKDDSFHAGKKACRLIRWGAVAIFGPSDPVLGNHVQSMCDALDIPHMEARCNLESEAREFSINLYPCNNLMSKAYRDLIHLLDWRKVALLFQDDYGFLKLQDLLRKPAFKNMEVFVRQCDPSNYRDVLRMIKNKKIFNVIVDTRPESMSYFLRAVLQLQMNDYYHHYLFTTFDLETFDLEDFKHNFVNISAFRIVNYVDSENLKILAEFDKFQHGGKVVYNDTAPIQIPAESAMVYDSVYVFARGLHSLERSSTLRLSNITCEEESPWNGGSSLFNYINSVEFYGLTGKIQFKEGRRTNVKLDLLKLRQDAITKVGEWTQATGLNVTTKTSYFEEVQPNFTLVVTTIEEIPYVMIRKNDNLTGNDRFEGFCIDLLEEIADLASFNYVIELVPDKIYGALDTETNEWNGMVRQLLDKKADLAVASMTINYAREQVIDFTKPFMSLGIGILFKVPTSKSALLFSFLNPLAIEIWVYVLAAFILVSFTLFVMARFSPYEWSNPHPCCGECDFTENQFSLSNSVWFITGTLLRQGSGFYPKVPTSTSAQIFSFMNPLAIEIWLYVLTAYITVSLTMFAVARFSPYEWHNPHPCIEEPAVVENQFSLSNSFWFTIGTLVQQGSDLNPKAASTRIVGGIWWFFTLIIISSYTANLAAFLTVERMISPIQSVEDLVEQNEITYGTLGYGSTMTFFRDSNMEMYQKLWHFMASKEPSVFVSTYEEGVNRVLQGNYAFLMESTMLDYFTKRNCNLMQIGGLLDSKGYGIATPIGSPWRDKISLAILELQEKGTVTKLYNKWWQGPLEECGRDDKGKDNKASSLGVDNIGGIFVVLMFGLALAIFVAILEFFWKSKKNAQTDRQSLCSEMAEELRFAVRCRGSRQRPALRRQCNRCVAGTTYVPANLDTPQENGIMQMLEVRKSPVHLDCGG